MTDLALASRSEIRIICKPPPIYDDVDNAAVHPNRLDRILSAEGELQPVLAKAQELRVLSGLVYRFLSADVAAEARVVNFKDSQLVLAAANSSVAAKVKLLAPALARFLVERRWQVNSVSVRVQPSVRRAAAPARRDVQLSTPALQALQDLHSAMRPSPAREALERLLRRRAARKGKPG